MLDVLRHYVVMAVRVLLRRKLFTGISLFGITFTLMALVLATAFLDHALGPVPPEVNQDRTVIVDRVVMRGDGPFFQSSGASRELIERYVLGLPGSERISILQGATRVTAYRNGSRIEVALKRTDANFWRILSFSFLEGGPFTEKDLEADRRVAVISASARDKFFDGAAALGQTLELNTERYRIVGVVPDVSMVRNIPWADVWIPNTEQFASSSTGASALVLARSRLDIPHLRRELRARLQGWQSPEPRRYNRVIVPLDTRFEKIARQFGDRLEEESHPERLWGIFILTGLLFMVLPAVNLVNLNVSRILDRASEIGVRKAFGASSRTLVVQFLVENVILTLVGSGLALMLSAAILQTLRTTGVLGAVELTVNVRVFLWGLLMAVVFGLVSGVYPAWRMARLHPLTALGGGRR